MYVPIYKLSRVHCTFVRRVGMYTRYVRVRVYVCVQGEVMSLDGWRTEPNRTVSNETKPNRIESNRTGSDRIRFGIHFSLYRFPPPSPPLPLFFYHLHNRKITKAFRRCGATRVEDARHERTMRSPFRNRCVGVSSVQLFSIVTIFLSTSVPSLNSRVLLFSF